MTADEANELSRLASMWAVARVRKTVVTIRGVIGNGETEENTSERERKANSEFHEYLRSLIHTEPFVLGEPRAANKSHARPTFNQSVDGEKIRQISLDGS